MKIFIGIDGGGTKTKSLTTDENFKTLNTSTNKATNLTTVGIETVSQIILEIIEDSIKAIGVNNISEVLIATGLAGAGRKDDCDKLKFILLEHLNKKFGIDFYVTIVTDAVIALEGALSGEVGAILIAGTGSVLYGKDDKDNFFRVGGFGKILGDEGSGYSIGRKALQSFSHSLDGRKQKSKLDELISSRFEISELNLFIKKVYSGEVEISSLAPIIVNAAEQNIKEAVTILNEESDELIKHIPPFLKHINSTSTKLSFIGSLIASDNFYSRLLKEKIKTQFPQIKIITAENSPELGAVILAKRISESGQV